MKRSYYRDTNWSQKKDIDDDKTYYMERIADLKLFVELQEKQLQEYLDYSEQKNLLPDLTGYETTRSLLKQMLGLIQEMHSRVTVLSDAPYEDHSQQIREIYRIYRAASNLKPTIGRMLAWFCTAYNQSLENFAYPLQMLGGLGQRINYDRTTGGQREIMKRAWRETLAIPESQAGCIITSSAMSSLGLIEKYLFKHHLTPGSSIFIPRILYSESELSYLKNTNFWKVDQQDMHDADDIFDRIAQTTPDVLLLETMQNSYGTYVIDMERLLGRLSEEYQEKPLFVLIDDTLIPGAYNPYHFIKNQGHTNIHIFICISALKYLQCGLDITTAGITYCPKEFEEDLQDLCNYAGYGIYDSCAFPFPIMTRSQYLKRQERSTRNGYLLASIITKTDVAVEVKHPLFESNSFVDQLPFLGCIVTIDLLYLEEARKLQNFGPYFSFMDHFIELGRQERISIVCSESFGFDTTRVSINWCRPSKPFLRISVGTESYEEIQRIGKALKRALESYAIR